MKSTDESKQVETRLYTVPEIARLLNLSDRKAYKLCTEMNAFEIVRIGRNIRVRKDSFDAWFDNL